MSNAPEDKISALERTVLDNARAIVERTRGEMNEARELAPDWNVLEQRFAVLQIQARAQEARKLEGGLRTMPDSILAAAVNAVGPKDALLARLVGSTIIRKMADGLEQRSHDLEALAMRWAQQWPPEYKPAPGKLVEIKDPSK